jgi:hypothetical protein
MSNGTPVPATAFSASFIPNPLGGVPLSELAIGGQTYGPSGQQQNSSFIWLVVVDLNTLNVVANDVSTDGATVPADISQYAGNPQYFLYAISNAAWASVMPQGNLYALLQKTGSGDQLARLEQIYAQLSTGFLGTFSYILAATMAENDEPGFETLSMTDLTILTMAFLPVTVNGQTVYAPIQTGS